MAQGCSEVECPLRDCLMSSWGGVLVQARPRRNAHHSEIYSPTADRRVCAIGRRRMGLTLGSGSAAHLTGPVVAGQATGALSVPHSGVNRVPLD